MSPTPSAGHIPPPVRYPDAETPAGHRLRAGIVTLIIAVCVVVAAAVTVGAVLATNATSPPPAPPDPAVVVIGPGAAAKPAAAKPSVPPVRSEAVMLMSTSKTATIVLGPGISLTPVDGWDVKRPGDNEALLDDRGADAVLDVTVGTAQSTDSAAELGNDVQQTKLTHLQKTKCQSGSLTSRQFQQITKCGFTADLVTQQGTVKVLGVLVELMNPTSAMSAFAEIIAGTSSAFDAAKDDASAMLNSML